MPDIQLRLFQEENDLSALVALYNEMYAPLRPLYSWPITVERFQDKVLRCWEYLADGFWVALDGERLIGFVLSSCRKHALIAADLANVTPPHAFLSAIVVDAKYRRRGIGSNLLEKAEAFARVHGCRLITPMCNPAAPMAFTIGPQEDWHEARAFLNARDYDCQVAVTEQSMVRSLQGFTLSPDIAQRISQLSSEGYECRMYRASDHDSMIEMIGELNWSGWPYWVFDIESKLGGWPQLRPFIETCFLNCASEHIYGPDDIAVIVKGGRVLSFCVQTINPTTGWAYLGPVATRKEMLNTGFGSVVVQTSLAHAAGKGAIICDLWTSAGLHHSRFYNKNGFYQRMIFPEYSAKQLD